MSSAKSVVALAAVGTMALSASAGAQTLAPATPRPEQGYFERTVQADRRLDIAVTTVGAYDSDLLAADSDQTSASVHAPVAGSYTRATGRFEFFKRLNHGDITLSEASTFRYYPSLADLTGVQHAGAMNLGLQINRARLNVSQSLEYRPYLVVAGFPALFGGATALPPMIADQTSSRREERIWNSTMSLIEPIGRRMSLSFGANLQKGQFLNEPLSQDHVSVGGRLTRNLTRDVAFIGGYNYEDHTNVRFAQTQRAVIHNLDVGLDVNRPIGRSRRTTIGFTSGVALLEGVGGTLQRQLRGNARLNREIGRTWHLTSAYNRGVGFLDGFQDPFFADAFSFNMGGTVNRRVDLLFTGGYSVGDMTSLTTGYRNGNQTYNGSARLRVALSRRVAFSSEYIWYHYDFDVANGLPPGMPPTLDRRGLRVGLDMFIPVVR